MTPDEHRPRRPARAGPRTILGAVANASLVYPLLVCVALYGEWLFVWSVLGHPPRPMLDDPKYIPESRYLNTATALLLQGLLPAAGVAFALQMLHGLRQRDTAGQVALRVGMIVLAWGAVIGLMIWDPGRVFYWWMD